MVYAERSYFEWAAMAPWQRDDFTRRFVEYQKKRKEELERQEQEYRSKMPSLPASGQFK